MAQQKEEVKGSEVILSDEALRELQFSLLDLQIEALKQTAQEMRKSYENRVPTRKR